MEEIVGVAVDTDKGETYFVLIWDGCSLKSTPSPLAALVLQHALSFSIRATPKKSKVCDSLQEAAMCPYFYERFFHMAQEHIFRDPDQNWA